MFWTGGITNPLDVIEQITYLMFIRELGVVDNEKSSSSLMLGIPYNSIFDEGHQLCRWSKFKNYPAEEMYKIVQEQVFPFIKGLHGDEESAYSKYMADAIFKIPTPQLLEQIVTAMDEIDWKDSDIRGDLYEYLLSKIATAGTNGQFRTPRHIIRMMVDLVAPNPEDVICDAYMGTGAICTITAANTPGTIVNEIVCGNEPNKPVTHLRIGHPWGIMDAYADLQENPDGTHTLLSGNLDRTARRIMEGYVYVRK